MVMYGQQIWASEMKFKYQKEQLNSMQRKVLLALTRCYRTKSYKKLYGVMGVLDLPGEVHQLLKSSTRKETLWCIIQHGPFRAHLRRIVVKKRDECRFCAGEAESVEYLLNICPKFRYLKLDELSNETDLGELESRIAEFTKEIWRQTER